MTRYFAGNTLAAFLRSGPTVQEVTTAGRFDATYVTNAIIIPQGEQVDSPVFSASPVTLYVHFNLYTGTGTGSHLLLMNGATNAYRILVTGSSTTWQLQYWNTGTSAWVNVGASFGVSGSTLHHFDLKIVLGPSGSMELFDNTVSIASGAVGANAATTITKYIQPNPNVASNYLSEVMIADYDLRNSHLLQPALAALGTYTDGSGAASDVNEVTLNDATAMSLATVGHKRSFTHGGITVPGGFVIGAMVISARGRVSGGVVTDGKIGVKSGATYSASAGKSYGVSYEPRTHIIEDDPATATRWIEAGFDAAEIVLEAA